MHRKICYTWILMAVMAASGMAQETKAVATNAIPETLFSPASKNFDLAAVEALEAMKKRAEELKIVGAAVVAYVEGENTTTWSSKMAIVGTIKNPPNEKTKGANLLAFAYSKASEMAETYKNSGEAGRPPMTGETGWQGGLIIKSKTGYIIAAFSGGPSESDLKVSRAGLEVLKSKLD